MSIHPYIKRPRAGSAHQPWAVGALCSAYDWPVRSLAGGGVIGIVELGGGWLLSDMSKFFGSIGQLVPSITDVSVDGTTNTPGKDVDSDTEVALDIQVAGASYYAATGKAATIRIYWSQDIASAVAKASADGCDVCSISWGDDEANWGTQAGLAMNAAAQAATEAGMIVFAAAGDNDSSDGGFTPANVDLPASAPYVVGCGGTTKTTSSETVWNNNPGQSNGEGTGGGYSTLFPNQTWQLGAPPLLHPHKHRPRMVPDVAANADPNTGYLIIQGGTTQQVGGTSAVAPLYAGLFAAFGAKLGYATPKLWEVLNHLCFNDITQGDNGTYHARVGPDPCTGLGSPIGSKLAALFIP